MKFIRGSGAFRFFFISLFLGSPLIAREFIPWFTPPFEFHALFSPRFEKVHTIQSPIKNFTARDEIASFEFGLNVTPWPYWNCATWVILTQSREIPLSYEASYVDLRYALLDDLSGDAISLISGARLFFPGSRYLHNYSFLYHGEINAEFHLSAGKEWWCREDWLFRMWGLGCWGFSNRGSPWLKGLLCIGWKLKPFWDYGLYTQGLYGFGHQNLLPTLPFSGYASIAHRSIILGNYLNYTLPYFGTLTLLGWYTAYSHNQPLKNWGITLSVDYPFTLL